MNARSANFVGYISPTDQSTGFFIPIFRSQNFSNQLLVQDVDKNQFIVEFLPLEINRPYTEIASDILKTQGDAALWYFVINDDLHIFGSKTEIGNALNRNKWIVDSLPHIGLQIASASNLSALKSEAEQKVYASIKKELGSSTADSWIDVEIFTPLARGFFEKLLTFTPVKIRSSLTLLEVSTITSQSVNIFIPEWLMRTIADISSWEEDLILAIAEKASKFDIIVEKKVIVLPSIHDPSVLRNQLKSTTDIKIRIMQSINRRLGFELEPKSRSYFEDERRHVRAVCTLSNIYSGRRLYWYGYHRIWDEWLSESDDAFLVLGCIDRNAAFLIPITVVRKILPFLRTSSEGRNLYWHIDMAKNIEGRYIIRARNEDDHLVIDNYAINF